MRYPAGSDDRTRPGFGWIFAVIAMCLALCLFGNVAASGSGLDRTDGAESAPLGLSITATGDAIRINLPEGVKTWRVESRALFDEPSAYQQIKVRKRLGKTLVLDRLEDGNDRLYHRYRITLDDDAYECFVSDVERLSVYRQAMPWPKEVKGVSCPVDVDDLAELGARHTHININLNALLLPNSAPNPEDEWVIKEQGVRLRLNADAIRRLDSQVSSLTSHQINVVAVVINIASPAEVGSNPWVHPDADLIMPDRRHAAFNLSSRESLARFTGLMAYLSERYSRPDKQHGWIGGYIIGNEVDSHWTWHNMGPAPLDKVARHYIDEVRLAWLSVRRAHPQVRVFVSLTHSWTRPNGPDPLRNLAGKALLDELVRLSTAEGGFNWHVAYHPYPQDLRNPRFWMDHLATYGYDTPMVTFKNLEVLTSYLNLPPNQINGEMRSLILSEQGFDTPMAPYGEDLQAAAYALSYERIQRIKGIDAYILHRHVDHRDECGLHLGLWTEKPPPAHVSIPDKKKRSWYVFKAAGTPQWRETVQFALPIIGLKRWDEVWVHPLPIPQVSENNMWAMEDAKTVARLVEYLDHAVVSNAIACESRLMPRADGGVDQAIYLHPDGNITHAARAHFNVELPRRQKLAFEFSTHLEPGNGDGVVYRVKIGNDLQFERASDEPGGNTYSVGLEKYAGQKVTITLEVDARDNNAHDWAYWINPRITADPSPTEP